MKNITTALMCLLFSFVSFGQCDYTLKMLDSWGDGWNGNTIDVLVDGTIVLDDVTMTDGSEESLTFQVTTGADVTIVWNGGGSYGWETSYEILDNDGTLVGSGAENNIVTGTITAVCPIVECNYSLKMIDSWGDGWNGNTIDVLVDGTIVLDDVTMTDGSEEIVTFTVADGSDVTTIWNGGGSYGWETSYDILDTTGTVVGSGAENNIVTGTITAVCPSCATPSGLTIVTVSTTGAVISWVSDDTIWEYELVLAGETPTELGVSTTDNPITITGCYANTAYDLYIRTDCGGTYSTWSLVSFTTLCEAISTIPYYEGFNSDSTTQNCWTVLNENGDTDEWNMDYTFNPFEGDEAAMMYTDFNSGSNDDWLISPGLVLTGNERLKFHQRVQSSFEPNDFEVLLSTTGIAPADFTNVISPLAEYDNTDYIEYVFDLSAYSGVSYIAFHVPNGGLDGWRLYIDNFIVETIPSCIAPSDLLATTTSSSSANLSWTGDASAQNYELVIQDVGAGEPTTSGTLVNSTTFEATGLTSNTSYEFYVRADCGASDGFSVWAGPISFTTLCDAISTIPYYEGFNSDSTTQNCWTVLNENGDTDEWNMDYTFNPFEGDEAAMMYTDFNSGSNDDWLISPGLVLTGNERLKFHQRVQSSFEPNDFEVLLSTTGIAPGDFTNVISPLAEYDNTDYIEYVFDLSAYSGISYIAFHVPDGGLDGWRLYIDNFIVETIPACGYPSGLNISNITGTTADFDWVAQNGNESWEYVIVPTGDPAPTGAGVFTAVNSTTFTDLDFLTTYDVYVRAYCGTDDGYSIWSGPETFTTTQQTNYTVDCASGQPVNIEYCYTNNDTTFWVFTSTDGFPLEITFNAGTIEANWDDLTIYDGSDNSGAILFNNNSAGINDLTGVVVESTSTSIYIEVDSDSSVSCSSSTTYSPWDFDVTCKTCITQTVEFDIVGSCEPNQEFYVEANITDLGSASNLELTDDQGSATQTATATSVVTFGPYAANTQVVISVLNTDDTSCLLESDPLTFLCPPPPNECSIVYAGEDTTFCSDNDPATVLTASYHIAGQDTTSYDVTSLDECPAPILEGGTPTSIDTDDIWSDVIDLGFDFCFFGETYSQILIGSNGVLSFELENAGNGNGWNLQGFGSSTPDQLPNSSNTTISEANIFGVGHDIDPSDCGEINYMVLGTAPARQFVVNYNDVCHFGFSCSDYTSTSQIILYESSNFIDVNIIDKPICTEWNDGLAVVGIQNIDDTIAFTPEDRNTSAWEASNESWRFSPSVGEANYIFEWYDGDTVVGTEDTITVYPEETTTYTAAVTYNLCNGETATVTDTVLVEITPTPIPVAVENDVFICAGEEAVLEVNIDASAQSPDVIYYWTYDNVDIQSGPENTFVFAEGAQAYGEYLVTAYNEETACYAGTVITVLPGIVPELEEDTSFNKCVNGEVELSVNIINDPDMTSEYNYAWYVDNQLIAEDTSGSFIHGADLTNGPVVVMVTNLTTSCASETIINVNYFQNQNCVDIPQGISPNGDGLNDCLVLDHLEEQEDIVKAEIYNRYGVKVFELNDYVDHWCGQDASSGSSDELLPVGTYFYVIQYASGREPTISWIYLNY